MCIKLLSENEWIEHKFLLVLEYASVGYTAKRVQMRKNRFLAIQKMAKMKSEGEHIPNNTQPSAHHPKQMVSANIYPLNQ